MKKILPKQWNPLFTVSKHSFASVLKWEVATNTNKWSISVGRWRGVFHHCLLVTGPFKIKISVADTATDESSRAKQFIDYSYLVVLCTT